jgi:hypothetical protein
MNFIRNLCSKSVKIKPTGLIFAIQELPVPSSPTAAKALAFLRWMVHLSVLSISGYFTCSFIDQNRSHCGFLLPLPLSPPSVSESQPLLAGPD